MREKLEFQGTWRTYQKRVLLRADEYLENGKIHIVAAPGSGKTTLGIELIGKLDRPALILAPSITIREQWIERIRTAFLKDPADAAELSNSLKRPTFITVATYQALHSAMNRLSKATKKQAEEQAEDVDEMDETDETLAPSETEQEDYAAFDLIEAMRANGLGTLCLDECHHLRSEWWKALEKFRDAFDDLKIIALTATPPYDSTPAMWNRYIDMCGEIDEEITIPELVKEGSLCPHQDYVYFNYPTREEQDAIEKFKQSSEEMLRRLMADDRLAEVVRSHRGLNGGTSDDLLLEDPAYLSSILIYLQEKHLPFPSQLVRLLGAKRLPSMEEKWMERLLQGVLYDDVDSYVCDPAYRQSLIHACKQEGLIERKRVCMTASTAVEKQLIRSMGKIESIRKIVFQEYASMRGTLRMLILTDYIRRECEKNLGNPDADMNQLGVLPFFETLRREADKQAGRATLRLGVLCGSVVIIPAEAKESLIYLLGKDAVSFSPAGMLTENEYLSVKAIGDTHALTGAVTELFSRGDIQVLIGTKSLLGEGWDAPCVNSLILASFVGSFMLSNQMRGRAIRVDREHPDKTSNVWHLVCLRTMKERAEADGTKASDYGEDFQMLSRRLDHFLGLHYEEPIIESGMDRLSVIKQPFTKLHTEQMNQEMLKRSNQREQLKSRWQDALTIIDKMEVVDEIDISNRFIPVVLLLNALRTVAKLAALLAVYLLFVIMGISKDWGVPGFVIQIGLIVALLYCIGMVLYYRLPAKRLQAFGNGILEAMKQKGLLSGENCKVEVLQGQGDQSAIYLKGGTGKEKDEFSKCLMQFFQEIDNQRYILAKQKRRAGNIDSFFAVPDAFSSKKEDAQLFVSCAKKFIGDYELVYTRNEAGRKLLLEARVQALGNRQQRCLNRKRVKSALE